MALRQLSGRCLGALQLLQPATAAAAAAEAVQQQCGRQHAVFQQLVSGMRGQLHRQYGQAFQPSRLYPKQHATAEAYVFWAFVGLNLGMTFVARSDQAEIRHIIMKHFRTSVEAAADGRWYTLLTSTICHTSMVHCAVNLLMLGLYRRTQPLTAREMLLLYILGGLVGNCSHLAWCWHDAAGQQYGLKYAINTPGLMGCSGAVAAISAYKAFLEPLGLPHNIPVPLPLFLSTLLYCCLFIREPEYSDYNGKFGAAAFGLLAAAVAVAAGRRAPTWRQKVI